MPEEDNATPVAAEATLVVADDGRMIALESQVQELLGLVEGLKTGKATLVEENVALQGRVVALEQFGKEQFVRSLVLEAQSYRDAEGRAHPKVYLDWLGHVLLGEGIGEGDDIITLEAGAEGIHSYYRRAIHWLTTNMPDVVPMQPAGTEPDKTRRIGAEVVKFSEEALQEIRDGWGLTGTGGNDAV